MLRSLVVAKGGGLTARRMTPLSPMSSRAAGLERDRCADENAGHCIFGIPTLHDGVHTYCAPSKPRGGVEGGRPRGVSTDHTHVGVVVALR